MIDVLLLGTGAMMPLPRRWLSSVQLRVDGSLMLLDCGEGTQIAMREAGWGFKRLDVICLTHHHADHVAGLPGLFHTVSNAGRTEPMHIYGPPGTVAVITGLRVIAPYLTYPMIVHELEGGATFALPSGLMGRVAYGEHRLPVLAYRFDLARKPAFQVRKARALGVPQALWRVLQDGEPVEVEGRTVAPAEVLGPRRKGISLAFATDTRPVPAVRELVRGVNLLISEGTYGDDADAPKAVEHGHMTFREAATLAGEAAAEALWLTHFGVGLTDPTQWLANAQAVFPDVTLGAAGLHGRITYRSGYEPADASSAPADSPASERSMNAEIS